MAHHKSALKRIRQSNKKRLYNRLNKKNLKFAIRAVKESKNHDEAIEKFNKAVSLLDRIAAKGIIHKNNAANKKSSLSKLVKKLAQNS